VEEPCFLFFDGLWAGGWFKPMSSAPKLQPEAGRAPNAFVAPEPEVQAEESHDKSLQRLRFFWEHRRTLVRAGLSGLLVGTLLAFLLPKRYESTTQLMPPDSSSVSSGMAMMAALTGKAGSGLSAAAGDLLGMKSSGALFIGILQSETVEDRLIQKFDLKKEYWVRLDEDAREKLTKNTSISEDRKSGIITIKVTDTSPQRAAAIAQAYVEELNRLVAELSTSSAHRERIFLEGRLTAVKQELDQTAKEFSLFASKNEAIDIQEQGKAMVGAEANLMGQLIAAESELKGLEEIYMPNNVRVRTVEARIAELRKQIEKLGGSPETAQVGKKAASSGDPMFPSIRELPLLGVTYTDLYRRTKIEEALYEALTQENELAKVQEAKETPSVKVLDPAKVPERKSFPPRLLLLVLCSLAAMLCAASMLVIKTRWQEVDAQDPRKAFAQEVFHSMNSHMPWAAPNGSRFHAITHQAWAVLSRKNGSPIPPEENKLL
jgi:uncharacterized protein involved in exopolysaccharide biosynthesis